MKFFCFLLQSMTHIFNRLTMSIVLCACMGIMACDAPSSVPNYTLVGLNHLAFRCILADTQQGVPLDRCGCIQTQLNSDLSRDIEVLDKTSCLAQQENTRMLAYLGSSVTTEIGLFNLGYNQRMLTGGAASIINLDRMIPETTLITSDGLISDLLVHPYGDFTLMLLGAEGRIQVLKNPYAIRPELSIDFDQGSIADAVVWPRSDMALPEDSTQSFLYLLLPQTAQVLEVDLDYLSLVAQSIDINLAVAEQEMFLDTQSALLESAIVRTWQILDPQDQPVSLARISVDMKRQHLVLTHQKSARITVIDLQDDTQTRRDIDFSLSNECQDAYLSYRLSANKATTTCKDGIDNDGNGLVDQDDPHCIQYQIEAVSLSCPQSSQCTDQIDNDGDALIDLQDPDCVIDTFDPNTCTTDLEQCLTRFWMWEGQAPACDDGIDNDGDGLIDRNDPGCAQQRDEYESSDYKEISTCLDRLDNDGDGLTDLDDPDCQIVASRQKRVAYGAEDPQQAQLDVCLDGLDNDFDGLIDQADPGCFDPEAYKRYRIEAQADCSDGIDNDLDGLIDYLPQGGGDPNCYAASDQNEASALGVIGSQVLITNTLQTPNGSRSFAYVNSPSRSVLAIDLEADAKQAIYTVAYDTQALTASLRQQGNLANLWLIDQNLSLRSINLTAPQPLLTADEKHVYLLADAENPPASTVLDQATQATQSASPVAFKAFYIIEQGQALQIKELDSWLSEIQYDSLTRRYLVPREVQEALLQLNVTQLTPLVLDAVNRGYNDPQAFVDVGGYPLWMKPWNRFYDALGQSTRVVSPVVLSVNGLKTNFDIEKYPGFCRILRDSRDVSEGLLEENSTLDEECIIIGYDQNGQVESEEDRTERLAHYIDTYEGIQIIADDPDDVAEGNYRLAYEADLPNTKSNYGYMMDGDTDSWTMVDYTKNYCSLGVEEGDIVVVEKFYPSNARAAQSEKCLPYLTRNIDEGLEPLRYQVQSVNRHQLVLVQDNREGYGKQIPPTPNSEIPRLAISLPPPPYECVSQAISYYVRVANNQWILTHEGTYRHAWQSQGGNCQLVDQDNAQKIDFRLRADANDEQQGLNKVFENEWFRFRFGYQQASEEGKGIIADTLPYMVDVFYDFYVAKGSKSNFYDFTARSPQQMHWLPENDRIYIIDAARQELIEYQDMSPYLDQVRFNFEFR